jgi:ADP-ribose diphosphatase
VEAANRELMEEIGVEAQNLRSLGVLSVAPGFFSFTTEVFLATELSCKQMVGDEPEPLEVVHLPLNQLDQTIVSGQISEARSVAALYLVRCLLNTTT